MNTETTKSTVVNQLYAVISKHGVLLSCICLLVLVAICYAGSLFSYFLADDFGLISYVSHICGGHWRDYWLDWVSNTQRLSGMAVFRPWFVTTLVIDFLLWRANPLGFHLTNLLYYLAAVLLLFFVSKQLAERVQASVASSNLSAFFAAALFCVNPLHPESVTWISGRTDTICGAYFLAGVLCFLAKNERRKWVFCSLLFFWLAILTKEMAIALPVVVTAIAVFLPAEKERTVPWTDKTRLVAVVKQVAPYWLCAVVYFAIRYLVLGTFGGGYIDGLDTEKGILGRFIDVDSYRRLFFPIDAGIVRRPAMMVGLMEGAYFCSFLLLVWRLKEGLISFRLLGVIAAWVLATVVPVYQVWGLGANLEGARYMFFLTMPLSMLLSVLLLVTPRCKDSVHEPNHTPAHITLRADLISVFSVLVLSFLVIVNFRDMRKTNGVWLQAADEVERCLSGAIALAAHTDGKHPIPLLGLPKQRAGAHEIYNGTTFVLAVNPPFVAKSFADRFLLFDPIFFGGDQFINGARFRETLSSGVGAPKLWMSKARQWQTVNLPQHAVDSGPPLSLPITSSAIGDRQCDKRGNFSFVDDQTLKFTAVRPGDGVTFRTLAVSPVASDFLQFEYCLLAGPSSSSSELPVTFDVRWSGQRSDNLMTPTLASATFDDPPVAPGIWRTVRIPLSHHWWWFASGQIKQLAIFMPLTRTLEIRNPTLISDRSLRPKTHLARALSDQIGVYHLGPKPAFVVDASLIPGSARVLLQCTKANFFFDTMQEKDLKTGIFSQNERRGNDVSFPLNGDTCPSDGFFDIRGRALDAGGKPLGEWSEPITVTAK